MSPIAITISDAGAPPSSAAGSSSQNASNESGPADRTYVNPLTQESFSSESDDHVAGEGPFRDGNGAPTQVQAIRLRRNEGPLAAPSSPVSTPGSFHFPHAASGLSQDVDLDALLMSEAGSPHAMFPMGTTPEAALLRVGAHPANPLTQPAAVAGAAAVLQDSGGGTQWVMDSSSMDLSSLHNDWFDTFSEGSRIKHLQADQISVDGDRSEDGSMPVMTTHSSIEPPSPSGEGKGYRRPGTLLEIAARDQARSTRSFIKRHEGMMKDALASLNKPTAIGPTSAGAAPTFAQGQSHQDQKRSTLRASSSGAQKGKKRAAASQGVSDLKDTANGDWEYLLMQQGTNNVRDAIRPPTSVATPSSTNIVRQDPCSNPLCSSCIRQPLQRLQAKPHMKLPGRRYLWGRPCMGMKVT